MRSTSALLGALGALATMAEGAKLMDNPSPGDFIRRAFTSVAIIGDYVYIDGGEMSQKVDGKTLPPDEAHTMMNATLSFNISSSWATDKVDIMAHNKPAPKLGRQALWQRQKDDIFYVWGGRTVEKLNIDAIEKDTIWRFHANPDGTGEWTNEVPNPSDDFDEMSLPQRAASVTVGDKGFSFGGDVIDDSDPDATVELLPVKGMIVFDMESRTFSNESMPVSPYESLVGATAEYIPTFGPNGLVMLLGGYGYTLDTNRRNPEDTRSFANLTFFDPVTMEWGWQKATGDVPTARLDHCSVGVKSGDDKYDIFIFGGLNPTNDMWTFHDLHVLTLPGFEWTQIKTNGGKRSGHACVTPGNRQMISVGGINTHVEKPWEDKDPFPQGIGVFDMTALEWKDEYDPEAPPYEMPQVVREWYEQKGVDTVEWSSKKVENLFKNVNSDKKKANRKGAIAGGVVGGAAGVSLIALAAWWLMRRRRRAASASRSADFESTEGRTEMDGLARSRPESAGQPEPPRPPASTDPPPGPPELAGKEKPRPVEMHVPPAELPGSYVVPKEGF